MRGLHSARIQCGAPLPPQPGSAPPNCEDKLQEASRQGGPDPTPQPHCYSQSTHHRSRDPTKTLRSNTSRGPSSPYWACHPWGSIGTWFPLKRSKVKGRRQRESGGACLLTLQPRTIRQRGEIGATAVVTGPSPFCWPNY